MTTSNVAAAAQRYLLNDCINPICPRGGMYAPPDTYLSTYLCKYMYECVEKNLTLPNLKFREGQCAFYPVKLSRFAEKNKVCPKYQNS